MINLTGTLVNLLKSAVRLDQEPTKPKAQIMGSVLQKDGQSRMELLTVSISDHTYHDLQDRIGQDITLPVGAFAPAKGSVVYFGI